MTSLFNPTRQKKWSKSALWFWTVGFQLRKPQEVRLLLGLLPNELRPLVSTSEGSGKKVPTVLQLGAILPLLPTSPLRPRVGQPLNRPARPFGRHNW